MTRPGSSELTPYVGTTNPPPAMSWLFAVRGVQFASGMLAMFADGATGFAGALVGAT